MGNADTKLHFRKAVLQLTTKTQPILGSDDAFWNQFWGDHVSSVSDVFVLLPASEVRALRESAPSNLATLCYKAVERLVNAADAGAATHQEQQAVLNCVRILTRVLPYIFEDPDWRGFFWSSLPSEEGGGGGGVEESSVPLAHSLINALCDLLFCPDFTVTSTKKNGPDAHEDLQTLDSCEFIWEAGVGAAHAPPHNPTHDSNRKELLKLILTCCSQIIYQGEGEMVQASGGVPQGGCPGTPSSSSVNPWLSLFTSFSNRHALPLFTSLLNTVCGYDPVGRGLPYNHLLFTDSRECLVETCLQLLITALDSQEGAPDEEVSAVPDNLFINYLSRIHREEDFGFVLHGFTRLLNNPLQQTYLPHSTKKVAFHQELLVFFWKFCDYNKKFLFYVLKSSEVLEVLVPILFHLNDARADQSRVGLLHIGVFILLLLSGERNFGVRLNKPYTAAVPMDVPVFTGSHADLMVLVFHKIITTGHQRLQPLFDCLLTILVNVSPYIKSLSMVGANKLLHLLEAFCTPWFLYSAPHHHHLVFFLLETFNNIIQYQFDGNSNLVYTIIRKRQVFHALANLPCDAPTISRALTSRRGGVLAGKKSAPGSSSSPTSPVVPDAGRTGGTRDNGGQPGSPAAPGAGDGTPDSDGAIKKMADDGANKMADDAPNKMATEEAEQVDGATTMQGSCPAQEAPPGTQTCTLAALPRLDKMTEQASAHPSSCQLSRLTGQPPAPYTHHLITAMSPHGGESAPTTPSLDTPLASATDIATSFSPSDPRLSPDKEGDRTSKAPPVGSMLYPPSPHLSTKVQPPSHPHQELSFQQQRRQGQDKLPSSARPLHLQRTASASSSSSCSKPAPLLQRSDSAASSALTPWRPSAAWVSDWKSKLPLQTIMRLLQVLVPQVEKICIDKGLTDESEILRFLQHGTLVGLLPVPHPILIRKYQANAATATWFRTYAWGVVYLRNVDPPIWYDTDVRLFEIQRV